MGTAVAEEPDPDDEACGVAGTWRRAANLATTVVREIRGRRVLALREAMLLLPTDIPSTKINITRREQLNHIPLLPLAVGILLGLNVASDNGSLKILGASGNGVLVFAATDSAFGVAVGPEALAKLDLVGCKSLEDGFVGVTFLGTILGLAATRVRIDCGVEDGGGARRVVELTLPRVVEVILPRMLPPLEVGVTLPRVLELMLPRVVEVMLPRVVEVMLPLVLALMLPLVAAGRLPLVDDKLPLVVEPILPLVLAVVILPRAVVLPLAAVPLFLGMNFGGPILPGVTFLAAMGALPVDGFRAAIGSGFFSTTFSFASAFVVAGSDLGFTPNHPLTYPIKPFFAGVGFGRTPLTRGRTPL